MKRYMAVDDAIVLFEADDKDFAVSEAQAETRAGRTGVKVYERERTGRRAVARREVWPDHTSWGLE